MKQSKYSFRILAFSMLLLVVFGVFSVRLYGLQIKEGGEQAANATDTFTYYTRVKAARGEILDRNGNILIANRASFNILLYYDVLFSSGDPNENLRQLTNLCRQLDLPITDHFPVTMQKPYEYTTDQYSSVWNGYFRTFLNERDWDTDISAPQLVRRLRDRYHLPASWTEEEVRTVISVRYELELRFCTNLPVYELVDDIDAVSLAALMELNVPGVGVTTSTVREYHTDYAAHILGYVGDMNGEQWEFYKDYDYEMDAEVGQAGLEEAFELELHGTDGLRETVITVDGKIVEEHYVKEPVAGNNVELAIDINLQKVAEDELEKMILGLRETGIGAKHAGMDAEGGAVVAMSVKTGEVLACASYPTYDLSRFFEDYNEILQTKYDPLYNRALSAIYPPGSIFKMVTTVAALNNNVVSPDFKVKDEGVYMRFADVGYRPRCMLWTTAKATHGVLDVREALSVSCNYFFYELGWLTGIDYIDKTAQEFGLGEHTGIELPEAIGHRANPEVKDALYQGDYSVWYGGDLVQAAIGQSEHRYTPMQLCSYVATLANRGTRYQATFLRRVLSSDYEELVYQNRPKVLNRFEINDEAYSAYMDGMQMSAQTGTASTVFNGYPIAVCAKTGTAEQGSGGSDNGSFVLFAPANDPQIAIMVYVEKGAQGGNLGKIAKAMLDYYFSASGEIDTAPYEYRTD